MDDEAVLNSAAAAPPPHPPPAAAAPAAAAPAAAAPPPHPPAAAAAQPIPLAIRNWVFGTAIGVLLILIQISYPDKKGALILFNKAHRVNMEFMISAFILFLWATVVERTISCFGGCGNCFTVIFWKYLFGHIADILCSAIIGLLTSMLPSSVKVPKYITYIVCAVPTMRIFVIFLVIPLVFGICCFDNTEDGESGVGGGDGDGVGGGEDDNGGVAGDGNNGESGVGDGGVGRDIGGGGDGVGCGEDGDVVGVGEDSEDVGIGNDNHSGAIQMSSLDSASSIV